MSVTDDTLGYDRPCEAIMIDLVDNVAIALRNVEGEIKVRVGDAVRIIPLVAPIPMGHKFAVRALSPGEPVLKYGECIGTTTASVSAGEHIHVHNMQSRRARRGAAAG